MKLPRDVDGEQLANALGKLGYGVTRTSGSHMRLTTERGGTHHVTIPAHRPLRVGTLAAILDEVSRHAGMRRDELATLLFG